MSHRKLIQFILLSIPLLFLATSPLYFSSYIVSFLLILCFYVALTQGWNMFSGYSGYTSIGYVAFYGIGMYTSGILLGFLPYPITILCGGLVSGLVAMALGPAILRVKGIYYLIVTFTLSEAMKNALIFWEDVSGGSFGRIIPSQDSLLVYYLIVAVAFVSIIVAYAIKNSKFGLGLFLINDDELAAEAMGVNTKKYKLIGFLVSCVFAGVIGGIMAGRFGYMDPRMIFDTAISFQVVIMALLGGTRQVLGPIVGTVLLVTLSEFVFGGQFVNQFVIILGVLIILLVIFMPMGVIEFVKSLRTKRFKFKVG